MEEVHLENAYCFKIPYFWKINLILEFSPSQSFCFTNFFSAFVCFGKSIKSFVLADFSNRKALSMKEQYVFI